MTAAVASVGTGGLAGLASLQASGPVELLSTRVYYVATFLLVGVGTYTMIGSDNYVKKVIGLNLFQVGVFLFFIASAYVDGANPPILARPGPYVSPLPHVLILTAIVVGVSLTAVALGLVVRVYEAYGTLDAAVIREVRGDE